MAKYSDERKRGLRPFQPGQSGNPGGRPKKKPISDRYAALVEVELPEKVRKKLKLDPGATYGDAAVFQQLLAALEGDTPAMREIREAIEGKATIRIAGEDEEPAIKINISAIPKHLVKAKA